MMVTGGDPKRYASLEFSRNYFYSFLPALQPFITFLGDGQPDSITLRQRHVWFVSLANNEDIADSCGKLVTNAVFDVNNVK